MDKRQKKANVNAISTLANQLIATLCGIIIPWVMIDRFGSEAYGATTSIAQFLSYISLLEGGIGRAARGELYGPLAEGNAEHVSRVFLAVKRFFRMIGLAFLGYALILAFCYYDIADVSTFTRDYIFWMVIVIGIGKFAEFMGGYSNITLFNADQRQYVSNIVVIGTSILNVTLVVILTKFGWDLLWVKLASSLVFVLKPVVYTIYRKRNYQIIKTTERARLQNQWTAIGQHCAYFVQMNIDVFILTIFANLKYVAVYAVYHLISYSLRNIVTSLGGGMEAMFGDMIAKGESEALRNAYKRYKFLLTVLTITLFGAAMVLILPFVRLYTYGTTDVEYIHPLFAVIMLLGDAIYCLTLPCYNLPIAANKLKESRAGAYGEAIINVAVSMVLVFWNPLVGIAIGTLAAMVFKSVYLMVFAGKHILYIRWKRMIREFMLIVAVLVVIGMAGMWVIQQVLIDDYFIWALVGVCASGITLLIALVIANAMFPGMMKDVLEKLMQKKKHRGR